MSTPVYSRYALTSLVYMVMCSDDTWESDYEICGSDSEETAQDLCNALNDFYDNIKEFPDNAEFLEFYDNVIDKETIQSRFAFQDEYPLDMPQESYMNFIKIVHEACQASDNPKFNILSYQEVLDRCIDIDYGHHKGKREYYVRTLKMLKRNVTDS